MVMRPEDKSRILTEVQSRVVEEKVRLAQDHGQPLDEVLADSIYHERRRLSDDRNSSSKDELEFWRDAQRQLVRTNERQQKELLARIVQRYALEICGNFDERVYKLATRVGPPSLGVLLNSVSPLRLATRFSSLPSLDDAVIIQGAAEQLRRLHELGTVILAPTHVSNLDSIVMGFSVYRMGLPPVLYGAGLNLFSNRMIGFFMRNLGAYTVDRRKKDPLYKRVLKEYATLTLELGYDNLFFPGGTRCRSGAVERKLKLGLMGASIPAYINNLRAGAKRPKIFIVPATLSFQLALEAETLVDDFLKEVGKSRYIITDDEFSQPRTVFDFASQLLQLDSRIYLTLSQALDPFGNPVDDHGESLDPHGRSIDIARYVTVKGEPRILPQRDEEYTREVGQRIAEAYARDNVVQSTHVLARAVFTLLRLRNPQVDLVRLLRVGGHYEDMELREVYHEVGRLQDELRGLSGRGGVRLGETVQTGTAEDVVADGLRHFDSFHSKPACQRRGDRMFATDRNLLFYYQNRLEGYRLNRHHRLPPALTADHRSLRGDA